MGSMRKRDMVAFVVGGWAGQKVVLAILKKVLPR